MWETPHLINNSVMVRNDIPLLVKEQVSNLLLELHKTTEGKTILSGIETSSFMSATDADYDIVQNYITKFEKEVRLVEGK